MRITILPPEEDMEAVLQRLSGFHDEFLKKYAS